MEPNHHIHLDQLVLPYASRSLVILSVHHADCFTRSWSRCVVSLVSGCKSRSGSFHWFRLTNTQWQRPVLLKLPHCRGSSGRCTIFCTRIRRPGTNYSTCDQSSKDTQNRL